jgi:DNA-binding transcriptional regulator GbsR (MarR family)
MDRARRTFIDRLGHAGEVDGLSPIAGRLYAILLLSDEPQSLDDLAAALGVSKASVSTDARRLFERGIVERVTRPGDRRDYYEVAPDFVADKVRSRVDQWRRLRQMAVDLREADATLSPIVRQRLDDIDDLYASIVDCVQATLNDWLQKHSHRVAHAAVR